MADVLDERYIASAVGRDEEAVWEEVEDGIGCQDYSQGLFQQDNISTELERSEEFAW